MKFLCEQCKAKYQIADEKIAGKTVRMKCRKCGHQIEVRAAVTETSVNTKPPLADHSDPDPTIAQMSPPVASQRPSSRPATARMGPLATSLASARPPPRPGSPAPGGGGALAGAFQRQVEGRPEDAGASFDLSELSASDEWYVAINGVPVGPIRVAEVRRKAALGAVTEESLVWQEGLEEWRPVRAFSELAAAVREAATTGRASLLTPPPPEARASTLPGGGIRPSPPRAGGVPPRSPMRAPAPSGATLIGPSTAATALSPGAPRTAAAADHAALARSPVGPGAPGDFGRSQAAPATARSNVVPITSRLATAEKLEDHTVPFLGQPVAPMLAGDPFAAPAVPAVPPPPAVGSSPFVAALGAGAAVPRTSIFGPEAPPRRATPWIAIAMIVLAAAFGITAAIAIFFRPNPSQPTPVVIQMSGSPALPAPPSSTAPTASDNSTSPVASTSSSSTKPGPLAANANATAKPGATTTTTTTAKGPGLDLGGLTGSRVDPTQSDNGGQAAAAPGQCLSEGQVQSVISMHYAGIKRACWERSGSTKSAANISVSLTVSPGGEATGVSASGDDPVIANCIANDVRSWHFAGGGCAQRVNIPFHFVRQ